MFTLKVDIPLNVLQIENFFFNASMLIVIFPLRFYELTGYAVLKDYKGFLKAKT